MSGFEVVRAGRVSALDIDLTEFVHRATGARHIHLAAEDQNNAFMVAFPTLPRDSSGIAHVLEHTTLCGSERYPVRDPFFMMLRRSLNTYMNAFTGGDTTAYPFATQNQKDFENLLAVYLDAVFFPHLHELDFAQEGWRLESDDGAQRLSYHGVVYNEMKGAMSSPLAQLWQHLHRTLFPDTVYAHNSGGDPAEIPSLTHAALKSFHACHYHPSHAVFMTYGNFSASAHQETFERCVLDRFEGQREPIVSALQGAFTQARESAAAYDSDAGHDATHILWAWVCGQTTDPLQVMEAHLLTLLLLEHGASPVRRLLETSPLASAPSELCGIDDSTRQLVFICGVEGSEAARAKELEGALFSVLEEIAADGMAPAVVNAALDQLEMAQRDIGGDGYPFGLQLMGRILPAAMYRTNPLDLLDLEPPLEALRERCRKPHFVASLVQRLLLDNSHRVRLVMAPMTGKAAAEAAVVRRQLDHMQSEMGAEDLAALARRVEALAERQAQVDDPTILPRVTLNDVPPARALLSGTIRAEGPVKQITYECGSNGIVIGKLAFALPFLEPEELRVLPLFCAYLTEFGARDDDYLTVQAERAQLGAFSAQAVVRSGIDPARVHAWLVLSGKGLVRKRDALLDALSETLPGVRFNELARLQELLHQSRAEVEQSVSERGHQLAVLSAARTLSDGAFLDELWSGPSAIRLLKRYGGAGQDTEQLTHLFDLFEAIRRKLLSSTREAALIGESAAIEITSDWAACGMLTGTSSSGFLLPRAAPGRGQAWLIPSQVNFCAQAHRAVGEGHADAAVLTVLGRYLQDGFLHREIREKGGAYGSGAGFDVDSQTFRFFSYRDPRALETIEDFERAARWIVGDRDPERLEESILGAIRGMDQPRSPTGEAERAFMNRLCGRDDETRRIFRERVLAVTHDALHRAAEEYLLSAPGTLSLVGGEPISALNDAELDYAALLEAEV